MRQTPVRQPTTTIRYESMVITGLGCLLALALVKLGNPVMIDDKVASPQGLVEWLLMPWPARYGLVLLAGIVLAAIPLMQGWRKLPKWVLVLPAVWLAWQMLATVTSVDRAISLRVLLHYASVAACFWVGLTVLGQRERSRGFWVAMLVGFGWVILVGFDQHYGGLEATRRMVYEQPDWQSLPPDFLKRIASNRIFSTLFYANTLAGVVLLLLPALSVICWNLWPERLRLFRAVSTGLLIYGGLACLFWSGSKAGWLIAVGVGAVAILQAPIPRRLKWMVVVVGLVVALAGFGWRFHDYFRRGATSVMARMDYWEVAAGVVAERPMLGAGPGGFYTFYRERKPPEAEVTRLVHNDYLQQASDSGLPGALAWLGWIGLAMCYAYRGSRGDLLGRAVWLGLLAWVLQGCVEFGLFIPAISWTAIMLLGWSVAREYSDGQPLTSSLASER